MKPKTSVFEVQNQLSWCKIKSATTKTATISGPLDFAGWFVAGGEDIDMATEGRGNKIGGNPEQAHRVYGNEGSQLAEPFRPVVQCSSLGYAAKLGLQQAIACSRAVQSASSPLF